MLNLPTIILLMGDPVGVGAELDDLPQVIRPWCLTYESDERLGVAGFGREAGEFDGAYEVTGLGVGFLGYELTELVLTLQAQGVGGNAAYDGAVGGHMGVVGDVGELADVAAGGLVVSDESGSARVGRVRGGDGVADASAAGHWSFAGYLLSAKKVPVVVGLRQLAPV